MSGVAITEVGKECFSIRSRETDFHRNIYFKRFVGESATVNLVFDPGTKLDMPVLMEAADRLIGGLPNIHIIFLSHQDPDVSSNTPALLQIAQSATVIASVDTWRLVSMYGIPEKRFLPVEGLKSAFVRVQKTGHRLRFLSARYCHFRGALMCHDEESGVLFTGDLFGGLNTRKGDGIWADESSWEGISLFHQVYMPSSRALRSSIDRIAMLNPLPAVVAPRHGDLIRGDLATEFAARLSRLDVGIDLATKEEPEKNLAAVALSSFLDALKDSYPPILAAAVQALDRPQGFTTFFTSSHGALTEVKIGANDALSYFWKTVEPLVPRDALNNVRALFITSLEQFSLPVPAELAAAEALSGESLEPVADGETLEHLFKDH